MASSMPVPVSPSVGPGLIGRPSGSPVMLITPPHGLRDHVEGQVVLVRAALAEALHLGVDDAGIDLGDDVVAEAQPLDRAGREVLHEHVGLGGEILDELLAGRRLQVDGQRFLVGVEDQEIERSRRRARARMHAAGIAALRVLDLHHLGAEPRQRLRAGRPRLELRQIQHAHACETGERCPLGLHWRLHSRRDRLLLD